MPSTTNVSPRSKEIECLHAMSEILHCQLDRRTIEILLELIELGVHPEALADIVLETRASQSLDAM